VRRELWLTQARPEQLEPPGEWRVWYLRGGRGAGKSKTGSSTLAHWIFERTNPGSGPILAPTFADAKRCVEQKRSGLIAAGSVPAVKNWNRSEGVIYLENGAEVYLDGADDGALRIQGRNLRGAWCDEVGLWRDWDTRWNESLQPGGQVQARPDHRDRHAEDGAPARRAPAAGDPTSSTR
jgi:phage terminase large subunit-like protein